MIEVRSRIVIENTTGKTIDLYFSNSKMKKTHLLNQGLFLFINYEMGSENLKKIFIIPLSVFFLNQFPYSFLSRRRMLCPNSIH